MRDQDLIFIGTYGHVRALDKRTGAEVWTTSLPSTGYDLVTLLVENDIIYAGSRGHLFALTPGDGKVLWDSDLPSLGYGMMMLATMKSSSPPMFPSTGGAAPAHTTT